MEEKRVCNSLHLFEDLVALSKNLTQLVMLKWDESFKAGNKQHEIIIHRSS